jgi:hypothetical protein
MNKGSKTIKFKDDPQVSDIRHSASEEDISKLLASKHNKSMDSEDDNLFSEELYRKALEDAQKEQEKRQTKRA